MMPLLRGLLVRVVLALPVGKARYRLGHVGYVLWRQRWTAALFDRIGASR